MKKIAYYLFYSFAWFISILPMKLQYVISDFFYLIVFYIAKYRRDVVTNNLKNSFPDKSDKEIKRIEKAFYHHLVDLFIEEMAMLTMSDKEISKRQKFINTELIFDLYKQNIGLIGVAGHFCNWEWLNYLGVVSDYKGFAIYKPLSDKNFEKFMNKIREKYGATAIPMKETLRNIISIKKEKILSWHVFIADQSPGNDESNYWTTFLNQETPVYMGVEKIAKKFNLSVVFISMRKVKRGYYETSFELITDKPKETKDYEITEKHLRMLEKQIIDTPEHWIWSHKRWKHKRKNRS